MNYFDLIDSLWEIFLAFIGHCILLCLGVGVSEGKKELTGRPVM